MPLASYDGTTFVAFLDISGFKKMMRERARAVAALDAFYQAGYDVLRAQTGVPRVDGLFVSDSGVLFVRAARAPAHDLNAILRVIEAINRRMLRKSVMLTSSVAYGPFTYEERLEFPGIEKNPVFGSAYLNAYLDNAGGLPRLRPAECRVMCEGLPREVGVDGGPPRLLAKRGRKHRYFYWMVAGQAQIAPFASRVKAIPRSQFGALLDAVQDAARVRPARYDA